MFNQNYEVRLYEPVLVKTLDQMFCINILHILLYLGVYDHFVIQRSRLYEAALIKILDLHEIRNIPTIVMTDCSSSWAGSFPKVIARYGWKVHR